MDGAASLAVHHTACCHVSAHAWQCSNQHLEHVELGPWQHACQQLHHTDAQRPDIAFERVWLLFDDLGRLNSVD